MKNEKTECVGRRNMDTPEECVGRSQKFDDVALRVGLAVSG